MIGAMTGDFSDTNPALASLYPQHLDVVCARYDRALESAGACHAVIYSGSAKAAFLDDYYFPFKANPHFVGWAPLTALPASCIVYTPGETPILVYNQPHDYWHLVPGTPSGYWTRHFDVRIVSDLDGIPGHLPADREKCIVIGERDDAMQAFGIERVNPTAAINVLHFARAAKTDYELALMRLAAQRGVAGHRAAAAAFRDGRSEFDIHHAYCAAVRHTEAELPYGNIVALNEHAAVLHYAALDRSVPGDRLSFLIDAGAQVHGYASDITRTYSYDDQRFQDLIDRMDALQRDIVGQVEAGVDYRDLHVETHRLLAGVLAEADLARGDATALVESGVTSAFFPHGLGHLLGIQVHDVGGHMANESGMTIDRPEGHPFLRLTRALEEDMVLTIEPGLYVIDMLLDPLRGTAAEALVNWPAVDWLRPFGGIRIEDDVRVLAGGCENLTRDAFAAAA